MIFGTSKDPSFILLFIPTFFENDNIKPVFNRLMYLHFMSTSLSKYKLIFRVP